jgi:hypothetical protein
MRAIGDLGEDVQPDAKRKIVLQGAAIRFHSVGS